MQRISEELTSLFNARYILLPPGEFGWDVVLSEHCRVTWRQDKKFSGNLYDCIQRLSHSSKHRFFYLSSPAGTLLMDSSVTDLSQACSPYSQINDCTVVLLDPYDPIYYTRPTVTAWRGGQIVRRNAQGLTDKWAAYVAKGYASRADLDGVMERNRTIGEPLPCEKEPSTLGMLAHYHWTIDALMQSHWRMVSTDLD